MATLKKPKKRKYPKNPGAKASSEQLKRHLEKIAQIDKDYANALKAYNTEKKERENLRNKISKTKK